ncbi:hypothetical protein [Chamaesiphon sp. VAR_48_metabat_135_sub]|uniref:hypothetical protein n=1 Tax=Chamaesiphon sp. VAR_48_metabat_135_sub TaxID=2964699 RepID=UPI00286A132F|nr:hypothetical protein [Chamaesiphon sp. VAR_48_metabat_135_sub]
MFSPIPQKNLWFERSMAIIASIGFIVAIFDLTYLPWRDFYFRNIPVVIHQYDRFKGIETHRETERYLNAVEQLKRTVKQTGLASAQSQIWLQEMDVLSVSMIQNNPFQVAGKTGNLEKIKNEVRDRVQNQSDKGAFQTFWSQDYLTKAGWEEELEFYEQKVKPLIVTNYYRRLDESGNYVDLFWQIDLYFIGIFAVELLSRTYYIRRHNRNLSWQQAIVRRWYDLILLLPFAQFLRIVPVLIRWHQSKLVNLEVIQSELNRLFVGEIINELTDAVVVQVFQQTQGAIKQGQITRIVGNYLKTPHIDLNNVNEIEVLFELILEIVVYRVIPKIQPDLEAIFRHLFHQALLESPAYRNLKMLPGIGELPVQVIDRVVKEVSASIYTAIAKVIADPDSGKLSRRLAENLTRSIGDEMQRGQTVIKIESLVYDLLEEIKVTYSSKEM